MKRTQQLDTSASNTTAVVPSNILQAINECRHNISNLRSWVEKEVRDLTTSIGRMSTQVTALSTHMVALHTMNSRQYETVQNFLKVSGSGGKILAVQLPTIPEISLGKLMELQDRVKEIEDFISEYQQQRVQQDTVSAGAPVDHQNVSATDRYERNVRLTPRGQVLDRGGGDGAGGPDRQVSVTPWTFTPQSSPARAALSPSLGKGGTLSPSRPYPTTLGPNKALSPSHGRVT